MDALERTQRLRHGRTEARVAAGGRRALSARGAGPRAATLALAAAAAVWAAGLAGAAGLDPGALAPIAGAVDDEIAAGRVPGAVVVVGHRGEVVYRRAFGAAALAPERRPMRVDTVFDLASLTKVVATATAVLQLVDRGALDLDEPVARRWPEFAVHGKGAITPRDLLLHRAGLPAGLEAPLPADPAATLARLAAVRPVGPRGTFRYGDVDFAVLGALVARVAGVPLDAWCATQVFAPLGMRDTGFRPGDAVRDRLAPTLGGGGRRAGAVHDPLAGRLGGVAGNAGLFGTAEDLARFAQMILDGGTAGGARILSPAAVAALTHPDLRWHDGVERALAWDVASPYSADWAALRRPGAVGHTGFTGTLIWIDPQAEAYLVVLTSRLHPDGRGDARPLRRRIAAVVAGALAASPAPPALGIDVLAEDAFVPLAGRQVVLLTNDTGRDATGRRTADLLHVAPGVTLRAILAPEHGLGADREGAVPDGRDPGTGVPVHSLYGRTQRPTEAMLAGADAIVVDLQDAGVRFYTYVTTMAYVMEEAARRGIPVWVLDRPAPLGATAVQGPMLDPGRRSFTGYFPLPVRYGMTIGELARFLNAEAAIGADLRVVPMRGYRRDAWWEDTGLPWIPPSPNLRTPAQAILYPGVALLESANVSVGRGTPTPFEVVGAPWIDGRGLATRLTERRIPGVSFAPVTFTPEGDRFARTRCGGVRLTLEDRDALDAPLLGVELASALHASYPERFRVADTLAMIGSGSVVEAIARGDDPRAIAARWAPAVDAFRARRAPYLLYPSSPPGRLAGGVTAGG